MECPLSQTACKITKNIGFNIFYVFIIFIRAQYLTIQGAEKRKAPHERGASSVQTAVAASLFCHVYRECLERELQSLLGECRVDLFVEVELYSPIIGLVAPHAHCNVN